MKIWKWSLLIALAAGLTWGVSVASAQDEGEVEETAGLDAEAERYATIAARIQCYTKNFSGSARSENIRQYLASVGLTQAQFDAMAAKYGGDAEVQARIKALAGSCSGLVDYSADPEPIEEAEEDDMAAAPAEAEKREAPRKRVRRNKKRKSKSKGRRRPRPSPSISPKPQKPQGVVAPDGATDYGVNPWTETGEDALSTFAVDVDTGAYTIARSSIRAGQKPKATAVRVEEFLNYFNYDYPAPTDRGTPFSVSFEGSPSPFDDSHHILRVGVQGRRVDDSERRPANLVFLVDVSGSMNAADKLGLAKRALRLITSQMRPGDSISLVTYAGNTRVVLPPTRFENRAAIETAIEGLTSSGGTAMESGMVLAYQQALDVKEPGSINRVIVLSDGDANIGRTNHDAILDSIAQYVDEGITLSTVGFGRGNYQDATMEQLANKGNGNYHYIDTYSAAKRVFQEQLGGTLEVIAKDVKIQVEFDPEVVSRYRLVGYENRDIADEDFRDDTVDAGEIGAGHSVTALYELELTDAASGSVATVRLRHKRPDASKQDAATESTFSVKRSDFAASPEAASDDHRFAIAVAAFAERLRFSPAAEQWSWSSILDLARDASDDSNERKELIELVEVVKGM